MMIRGQWDPFAGIVFSPKTAREEWFLVLFHAPNCPPPHAKNNDQAKFWMYACAPPADLAKNN